MERKFSRSHIGKEYEIYQGYTAKVVDGGSRHSYCTIEVDGNQWEVNVGNLRGGLVKNPWHPSVYGVGYMGTGEKGMKVKNYQAYCRWVGMLRRCYDPKFQARQPTYIGCTVDEEWHSFYNFLQWYKDNVRLDENGIKYQLDKDLLSYGNSKYYGPDTCVFIPHQVNLFISSGRSHNESGYTGVYYSNTRRKYVSEINLFDPFKVKLKHKHLGVFETANQASNVYKMARIQEAKKVKIWMASLGYSSYICSKIT